MLTVYSHVVRTDWLHALADRWLIMTPPNIVVLKNDGFYAIILLLLMILLADRGVTTTTPESISGDPIQSFVERHKEVSPG